jgi:hypothetical protein
MPARLTVPENPCARVLEDVGVAADVDDLFHRATHVDVDRLSAELLAHHGSIAHLFRHAAEELDGERAIFGARGDELQGDAVALQQRAGVDEVGRRPPESAEFAHGEPHGQVGVACERREKQV